MLRRVKRRGSLPLEAARSKAQLQTLSLGFPAGHAVGRRTRVLQALLLASRELEAPELSPAEKGRA